MLSCAAMLRARFILIVLSTIIIKSLSVSLLPVSNLSVPVVKVGVQKHWWTPELDKLKQDCMDICYLWNSMGRPGQRLWSHPTCWRYINKIINIIIIIIIINPWGVDNSMSVSRIFWQEVRSVIGVSSHKSRCEFGRSSAAKCYIQWLLEQNGTMTARNIDNFYWKNG